MGAAFDLGEGAAAVAEDRLLAGPVALDLRQAFLVEPPSAVVAGHLSAMWAALPVDKPARHAGRWWAAGAVGVVLFGGSLAGAGALPAPAQHAIAGALRPIGLDLPDPDSSDNPGSWQQAPGQQTQPRESENAPGHGGSGPGQSDVAPGHSSTLPPQSNGVATPGRPDDPGGPADAGPPPDAGKAPDVTLPGGGEPPGVTTPSTAPPTVPPVTKPTPTTKVSTSPASSGGAGASGAPAGGDAGSDK